MGTAIKFKLYNDNLKIINNFSFFNKLNLKLLNVITLEQTEADDMNQMLTITIYFVIVMYSQTCVNDHH
jgi:hypothetical protein